MKCVYTFAVVVLVAMATKMAEACCLPDRAKVDIFYEVNMIMTKPNDNVTIGTSGIAAVAWDFTAQKFAVKFGPIMMKVNEFEEYPLVTRAYYLIDLAKGEIIGNTDGPIKTNECLSLKVQGQLTDKYQCTLGNHSGFEEVATTSGMTIYQKVDGKSQLAFALDANCVPTLLQAVTTLPNDTGSFGKKFEVVNIELEVEDDDFLAPCDNPKVFSRPALKIPPAEKAVEVLSAIILQAGESVSGRR
ncbi:uncharacterized protein LOC135493684 [Lineus longissimus]|uniref:uncharacterized protein LOC135493684 n=1 Tax=Lineus longissimus TaxID=88925 RepID=UPI002B4E073C